MLKYHLRQFYQRLRLIWKIGPPAYLNGLEEFRIGWDDIRNCQRPAARLEGRIKRGRLEAYAETGTEGFVWSVIEDGKSGYASLNCLEAGDELVIVKHDGSIAFMGVIDPDHEAGYQPYPGNSECGQPAAFGCWVHWIQRDWKPEDWAALFFHGHIVSDEHELLRSRRRPNPVPRHPHQG
jgi:hypothetical protein